MDFKFSSKREEFLAKKIFFPFMLFICLLGKYITLTEDTSNIHKQFKNDRAIFNELLSKSPYQLNTDTRVEIQDLRQIHKTNQESKELNGKIILKNTTDDMLSKNKAIAMNFLCTNTETTKLLSSNYILHFYVLTKTRTKYTTLNHILSDLNLKHADCQNNKNYALL